MTSVANSIDRVRNYIRMEYGEELYCRSFCSNYQSIIYSYVEVCMNYGKTIPSTANDLAWFLKFHYNVDIGE